MRVLINLFSPPNGGSLGSLTRALAVARALEDRGDQVAFAACGVLAEGLSKKGYGYYPLPIPTFFGLPKLLSRVVEGMSQRVELPAKEGESFGDAWLALVISSMAKPAYLADLVAHQLLAVEEFKPDILFTEMDVSAFLAARLSALPIACTFATPMLWGKGKKFYNQIQKSVNAVLRLHGRPEEDLLDLCYGPGTLKIVPSIPELEVALPAPDLAFVGNLLGELRNAGSEGFTPEMNKRYVFVYTGVISISLKTLERELPRIFGDREDLVFIVASQYIRKPHRVGNIDFRPFVLDTAILPYCDFVLCHGGHNTLIRSLHCGVPTIIFPGAMFERRWNADMILKQGAGTKGEISQFTKPWFESQLKTLGTMKANAVRLKEIIDSYPGPGGAVESMRKWVDHE